MNSGIPVVYIRGLLEGGKTTFLIDAIKNGDFGDVGKALILCLEQGEEEYDEVMLKKYNTTIEYIENQQDFNKENIANIVRKHKPQVIFIESNEMWDLSKLEFPSYFDFQQIMCIIDGTTFNSYLNNIREKFVAMIKESEIVIINRCKPTSETSQYKRSVKIINSQCTCIAIDDKGMVLKLESDLPFSLKEDTIKLKLSDFGAWYIDSFDEKSRYDGRIVEFDCMAVFSNKLPPKTFIAGRLAMTCCADDIQLIGHLCAHNGDISLKNESWAHIKVIVHYMKIPKTQEEQVVLQLIECTPIKTPPEDEILVTLV